MLCFRVTEVLHRSDLVLAYTLTSTHLASIHARKASWPAPVSVSPDPMRAGHVLVYSLGGPWHTGKAEKAAGDAEGEVSG